MRGANALFLILSFTIAFLIGQKEGGAEKVEPKVYPLDWAKAEEIKDKITETFSEATRKPTIEVHKPSNSLIVTATEEMLNRIEGLIRRMDVEPCTIALHMSVVMVPKNKSSDLIVSLVPKTKDIPRRGRGVSRGKKGVTNNKDNLPTDRWKYRRCPNVPKVLLGNSYIISSHYTVIMEGKDTVSGVKEPSTIGAIGYNLRADRVSDGIRLAIKFQLGRQDPRQEANGVRMKPLKISGTVVVQDKETAILGRVLNWESTGEQTVPLLFVTPVVVGPKTLSPTTHND